MTQTVLLIDDSLSVHALVRARLAGEPIALSAHTDPEAGYAAAAAAPPDLILLDADMPGIDAFALCQRLKAHPATAHVPVIFLCGSAATGQRVSALRAGGCDFVVKPFDPTELKARVRVALRMKYLVDLLSHKAMIDSLTGLWNGAYFHQRLAQEIALARRAGGVVGLAIFDIDGVQRFAATHGHPAFEDLVSRLASVLAETQRQEDVLCRIGAGELALLMPNTPLAGANSLALRLRDRLHTHWISPAGGPAATCSFGIGAISADGGDSHWTTQLDSDADRAAQMLAESVRLAIRRGRQSGPDRIHSAAGISAGVPALAAP